MLQGHSQVLALDKTGRYLSRFFVFKDPAAQTCDTSLNTSSGFACVEIFSNYMINCISKEDLVHCWKPGIQEKLLNDYRVLIHILKVNLYG